MSTELLSVGATVMLKSGGPVMTVVKPPSNATSDVLCRWFQDELPHKAVFPAQALETVTPPHKRSVVF